MILLNLQNSTIRCYQHVARSLLEHNQVDIAEVQRQYLRYGENIAKEEVCKRVVQFFLWIFGEGAMNIRALSRNLDDQELIQLLRKRVYRHYTIKDGLKNGLSFQQIQLQDVIRKWQQELLSKSTFSTTNEDALHSEIGQTLDFLTQPQLETLSWKSPIEPITLNRLVQEQIDGTLYLYQIVDNVSFFNITDKQAALITSLLGKGVALYLNKKPYSWIEALEDWSEKKGGENLNKFKILKNLLPLLHLIDIAKGPSPNTSYLKALLKKEQPILEGVSIFPCSFQDYITLITCLEIENSLFTNRGWQPFCRKEYEKNLKDSEFIRWYFLYYLVLDPKRLVKSPPKGSPFLELINLLRPFRWLFLLEKRCACPFAKKNEGKRPASIDSLRKSNPNPMQNIFSMITKRERIDDHLLEERVEKISLNEKIDIPSKFEAYLKWKKQITIEEKDEFFVFSSFLESEKHFNEAFEGYQSILQLLKQKENTPVFIEILKQPRAEEIVKVILEIAQSHLTKLDTNKVMALLMQNTKYPVEAIRKLLETFSSKVLANVFNEIDTGILHLLIAPTYCREINEFRNTTPSATELLLNLFPYYLGVSFRRGETTPPSFFVTQKPIIPPVGEHSVNGELFFKLYREFAEGKKTIGQVYLLLQYRILFSPSLTINDLLNFLQIDLPKPLEDSIRNVEVDYRKIFNDPFFEGISEKDRFTLWFSWAVKRASIEKVLTQIHFFRTLKRLYGLNFPLKIRCTILSSLSINITQIQAVTSLAKLRVKMLHSEKNFSLDPKIIVLRDLALQKLLPPEEFADANQEAYAALNHIWNSCFIAFGLSFDQVLADALTLKEVTRRKVIFSDPTFNHCAVLKELVPGKSVVVDWQPPTFTLHPELKVLIIDQQNGRGRKLSFPLTLDPNFTVRKQINIFKHLKDLANIVLSEGGGKQRLNNIEATELENVIACYPNAREPIEALKKIDMLIISLSFFQQVKLKTRSAWLDIVQEGQGRAQISRPLSQIELFQLGALGNIEPLLDESHQEGAHVGRLLFERPLVEEKKGRLNTPVIDNAPSFLNRQMHLTLTNGIPAEKIPFYSSLEITQKALEKASQLIRENVTKRPLVNLTLDGGFSRELFISSTSYSLGTKMFYKVQFCIRTEESISFTSSSIDYPHSLIIGSDFSNVFQIHILGFKSDIYRLISQNGKKKALETVYKKRKEILPTIEERDESLAD